MREAVDADGNVTKVTQKVTPELADDPSCCPAGSNIMLGTPNNDVLNGTAGVDCMIGLGGQDTLRGQGGADLMSAAMAMTNSGAEPATTSCSVAQGKIR